MAARSSGQTISVGGHQFRLTHPDKVIYPETGTTKADVIDYYVQIAPFMLPHVVGRPATRKRWVDGVGTPGNPGQVFFEKNLPDSAPSWIKRTTIQHKTSRNSYIVIQGVAELAWLGQMAALEIHVPQWQAGPRNTKRNPDRLVLDLDPGPGAGLPECVEVAKRAKKLLAELGLEAYPVTSGSKGIHLYAGLDRTHDAEYVNAFAKQFAQVMESELPELVVSSQKKTLRGGKVLLDWSQNNQAKTTIAPYSLRGRTLPTVAVPRTWRELNDPELRHLTFDEVLARMKRRKDPLASLGRPVEIDSSLVEPVETDRLDIYRSKRDAAKTPEPVPQNISDGAGNSFVIQEHHARRLHWDFRLERDGVLVSWALPNGVPTDPKKNHLAVQTEDHPLEYGSFEGTIPKGEYGAGEVTIWDWGTYEAEKWRGVGDEGGKGEVIAILQGQPDGGLGGEAVKIALIKTSQNWLAHRMKLERDLDTRPQAAATRSPKSDGPLRPMLASAGTVSEGDDWAYEMKWDGYRALAMLNGDDVRLVSRSGQDMSATYPRVVEALAKQNLTDTVLDGELVAFGNNGAPSFNALQNGSAPVSYLVFDLLRLDGTDVMAAPYDARRGALEQLELDDNKVIRVPPAYEGTLTQAVEASRELGLEGIVAKRRDSTYRPGTRSSSWLKLKHLQAAEAVIIGWRPGEGARSSTIGSLLLAAPNGSTNDGADGGSLTYIGRVGTGFSDKALTELTAKLARIERKTAAVDDVPADVARRARWVRPELVGEVTYGEMTPDGRLRHPVWKGLRPDKSPADLMG
jgi:bifunctional non-homologous end joining protein LigD